MLVHVRAQDLSLVVAVQRHLQKRVRAALGPSSGRVASVSLSLSDINGPRGGEDLRCVVTLDLLPRGSLRAEATDSDIVSAVGRALARARRALRGSVSRHRSVRGGGRAVSSAGLSLPVRSDRGTLHG